MVSRIVPAVLWLAGARWRYVRRFFAPAAAARQCVVPRWKISDNGEGLAKIHRPYRRLRMGKRMSKERDIPLAMLAEHLGLSEAFALDPEVFEAAAKRGLQPLAPLPPRYGPTSEPAPG